MVMCRLCHRQKQDCEAGSIGAVVGEMWGDYQVDDSNTLAQAQKDKLINQAKLIAGITAVFAGEDVNVAAGVAAEAVRWNGTAQIFYYNELEEIKNDIDGTYVKEQLQAITNISDDLAELLRKC
ncbi:VENN motif pre-toxin domain-containing protein [Moraxella catarrhalis]|uniref:VENN motif pre-toxin domain-containing protein n=1 Tax=Moraxella catarrhalis TaxID=480 RepID=UPI001D0D909A|nr:VENN motif pre-toxin domain-containing protein [Moraxella catarrhalis]